MTNEYNAVEKLHEKALKTAQRAYSSESNNDLDVFTNAHASVTKEVSMSFAEWIAKNRYYRIYGDYNDLWAKSSASQGYTTSELYDLYITKHLKQKYMIGTLSENGSHYPLLITAKDGQHVLSIQSKPVSEIRLNGKVITQEELIEKLQTLNK